MTHSWRYAAVHLGYSEISVVATGGPLEGPRESVGSAYAAVEGGRLVFGRPDVGAEISPLLCIDDPSIAVGTSVWDREEVLLGIVWSALRSAGVHDRLDVLEIAYPSTWGQERAGVVRSTFSASANEVVLVETAEAALASPGERAPSAAVVVEVGDLDTSVFVLDASGEHGGDTGAVVPFGHGEDDEWRQAVGEYVRSSVSRCPDEIFVVAPSLGGPDPIADRSTSWLTGLDIAGSLYRRAGADLDPAPSVRAATTRSAAWLDNATAPPPRPNRRASRSAIAAGATVSIVSVCAAVYFVSGTSTSVEPAAAQPFSPTAAPAGTSWPVVDPPPPPPPPPSPSPSPSTDDRAPTETVTFVSGRASMRLPATWTRLDDPDRMVVIPPSSPERRIVVTVADLMQGSTQEQVAAELRSVIDARGPDSTVGSFEPVRDFGGRVGIAYTETPVDDSTVLWRVFVESDLQVSIGCQFEGDDSTVIDAECDQATQTLEIVPVS
ncbi:type VII secretion-associated protein [Rhodococcus sp. 06-235-1A]|uniref:type VII secretion-associated protein n=1 Tax=Rhodococcus sp. 06-235-1A TaxID=2022508 RepID=UPI000B9A6A07|nr:type VII secretion-associated protein [Rhodococcus sp. 06-235-1A]OZC99235.1 type VII secretion-associated protein [Rhodococcus sp. 06-235-1A]